MLDAEDHHAQQHADLRRGEARAVLRAHRVAHVVEQRIELGRAEALHLARPFEQARIAHAQDVADHGAAGSRPRHRSEVVSNARTRSMPFSSTLAMRSSEICCALSPRPAAWLTTTQTAA